MFNLSVHLAEQHYSPGCTLFIQVKYSVQQTPSRATLITGQSKCTWHSAQCIWYSAQYNVQQTPRRTTLLTLHYRCCLFKISTSSAQTSLNYKTEREHARNSFGPQGYCKRKTSRYILKRRLVFYLCSYSSMFNGLNFLLARKDPTSKCLVEQWGLYGSSYNFHNIMISCIKTRSIVLH